MPDSAVTVSAHFRVPKRLEIKVEPLTCGRVELSNSAPVKGENITIKVLLPKGCEFNSLAMKDGKDHNLYINDDGSFTMPNTDVTITVKTARPSQNGLVLVKGGTISKRVSRSAIFKGKEEVTINDFYVFDHAVTQGEWEKYMTYYGVAAKGTGPGQSNSRDQWNPPFRPSAENGLGPNYPVYHISYAEAVIYCNLLSLAEGLTPYYYDSDISRERDPAVWLKNRGDKKIARDSNGKYYYDTPDYVGEFFGIADEKANGYRLLTEEEWEYASLGGMEEILQKDHIRRNQDKYPEYLATIAWRDDNPHEIKQKEPNSLGIYDMVGGYAELVDSLYLRGGQGYSSASHYFTHESRSSSPIYPQDKRATYGIRLGRSHKKPAYVIYEDER